MQAADSGEAEMEAESPGGISDTVTPQRKPFVSIP